MTSALLAALLAAAASTSAAPPAPTSSPPVSDGWPGLQVAAVQVEGLQEAPLLAFVRGGPHPEPLLDEDLAASLEHLRAVQPALAPLDAALARGGCVDPGSGGGARLGALGEWVLALAVADARAGKPKLAAASLGRAAELSATLGRCAQATADTREVALRLANTARHMVFALADDGFLSADALTRLATALRPTTEGTSDDAAVQAARAEQALLEEAAAALMTRQRGGAWPKELPIVDDRLVHGERWFALAPQKRAPTQIRCAPGSAPGTFTMTREAAEALGRRGPDVILEGSLITPSFDGSAGFLVARAGPVARSCGLVDGDVVVEVNGVLLRQPEDALVRAPTQVQRDRRAAFRVRRAGSEELIRVEPERPLAAGAP